MSSRLPPPSELPGSEIVFGILSWRFDVRCKRKPLPSLYNMLERTERPCHRPLRCSQRSRDSSRNRWAFHRVRARSRLGPATLGGGRGLISAADNSFLSSRPLNQRVSTNLRLFLLRRIGVPDTAGCGQPALLPPGSGSDPGTRASALGGEQRAGSGTHVPERPWRRQLRRTRGGGTGGPGHRPPGPRSHSRLLAEEGLPVTHDVSLLKIKKIRVREACGSVW